MRLGDRFVLRIFRIFLVVSTVGYSERIRSKNQSLYVGRGRQQKNTAALSFNALSSKKCSDNIGFQDIFPV